MNTIQVGILGMGGLGKTQVDSLKQIDGVEASVVCDLNRESAEMGLTPTLCKTSNCHADMREGTKRWMRKTQQFSFLALFTAMSLSASAADLLDFVWSGNITEDASTVVVGIKDHRTVTTTDEVVVRAYTNEAMTGAVVASTQTVTSAENHLARITLSGLQANTPYYYGVWVNGVQETTLNDADNGSNNYVGKFKTFPVAGTAANFSLAFSCGHDNNNLNRAVFSTIKNDNPLFYLCTGDFFYSDKAGNDYDPGASGSLDEFRGWYARALNSTAYDATTSASLYRALPIVYMWDDHDFGPNNCVGTSGDGAVSKLYAHPAYREYVPHYPLSGSETQSIHQAFTVGRIRFLISDLRNDAELPGTRNTRLGESQKSWLKEELLKANGTYPIIVWVSTVPWNGAVEAGQDRWQSYAYERTELADFIKANHIRGLCILSGDMHGVGIDDGTNTDFATDGGAAIPLFQSGAVGSGGSTKAGPYNRGARGDNGQYGLFEIADSGVAATATWTAKDELNNTVTSDETDPGYPAVGTPITYAFTNNFPVITSLSPADNSVELDATVNLVVTFNETIQKGSGDLRIQRVSDDAIERTIAVTSANITVVGNQMTINPPTDLGDDTAYYITMDEGIVTNGTSDFPGIYAADDIDYKKWNFSTKRIAANYALPFSEDFEALALGGINGRHGWTGGGTVQADEVYAGSQACQLANETMEHLFDEHSEQISVQFYAKPSIGEEEPSGFPTNATVVFYINTNFQIVAYSNQTDVTLSTTIISNDWNFFEVSGNYTNDTWSLSVNGTNALQNFPFYNASTGFIGTSFSEGSGTTSHFDNIIISADDSDSDGDGLPDFWELTYYPGITSVSWDDISSNGVNTVGQTYIAGLDPTNPASLFALTDLFPGVSNQISWQSVSGRTYTVYWTSNLLTGFNPIASNLVWPAASFTDTQHENSVDGFYKLDVELSTP